MRAIAGLWRWRGNPLYRTTDRVEGWLALAAVLLMTVGTPAVALWGTRTAHETLMGVVREQQRQRHQVWATVAQSTPPVADGPEAESGHRVNATWTSVDGRTHSGTVVADRPTEPGDRLRVWVDAGGEIAARPMDAATASSHAALAGFGTAVAAAGLVESARRLLVRRLLARRYTRWAQEWARVGPDWGRTGRSN
ncbi:hypothetical protein ACG5V6_22125 [Streptomyces chitinivorans]|uniref:Proline rich protein membrane protein n=1 Tax=Streptomyces chitinivorans TaxID=1257027 RepID=A0ABW7HYA4_9ACTN|nr:hypothetical protein [Streptomyces chitinivorans]MDH2409087.1 hypothetical protein [Streptomyces chitinivorans]